MEKAARRPYHHGDLRNALLAAARTIVLRDGVKGFTLKDAATLAGVSTAAPYRHFADKEALLAELSHEGFLAFHDALATTAAKHRSPGVRLVELGVSYVRFALAHPAEFRVMFGGQHHLPAPPALLEVTDESDNAFLVLTDAVRACYPRASAARQQDMIIGSWSMVHGFAVLHLEGAFSPLRLEAAVETQLRRILRIYLRTSRLRTAASRTRSASV